MARELLLGILFDKICDIIPECDADGQAIRHTPQSRYAAAATTPLHKYGNAPFCRFHIHVDVCVNAGVYLLTVNGSPTYVGECADLSSRFNLGYGNISPRNCYVRGQPTNCRINSLILDASKNGSKIELWFNQTDNRFVIERKLIIELKPPWNRGIPAARRDDRSVRAQSDEGTLNESKKGIRNKGNYDELGRLLANTKDNRVTVSFEQIEGIVSLPESAYVHRPWWANGRHTQAYSWMKAGWLVDVVVLGKTVTFARAGVDTRQASGSAGVEQATKSLRQLITDNEEEEK